METMLHIGASKEAVTQAKKSIIDIMNVDPKLSTPEVKIKALEMLKELCSVNGTTVSNCLFEDGVTKQTIIKQPWSSIEKIKGLLRGGIYENGK